MSEPSIVKAREYFEALKPFLNEDEQFIRSAPLNEAERIALALFAAAHMCGIVAGVMDKDPKEYAQEIADLIAGTMITNH